MAAFHGEVLPGRDENTSSMEKTSHHQKLVRAGMEENNSHIPRSLHWLTEIGSTIDSCNEGKKDHAGLVSTVVRTLGHQKVLRFVQETETARTSHTVYALVSTRYHE
jgi:hypothetical protein